MKTKGSLIFSSVLLLLGVILLFQALGYPGKSRTFPLIAAVLPLIFFSLVQTITEIKAIFSVDSDLSVPQKEDKTVDRNIITVFIWLAGFFTLIFFLGFVRAIPLFSFPFLKFYWREKWYIALLITLLIEVFVYVVFVRIFGIFLYQGIFWE